MSAPFFMPIPGRPFPGGDYDLEKLVARVEWIMFCFSKTPSEVERSWDRDAWFPPGCGEDPRLEFAAFLFSAMAAVGEEAEGQVGPNEISFYAAWRAVEAHWVGWRLRRHFRSEGALIRLLQFNDAEESDSASSEDVACFYRHPETAPECTELEEPTRVWLVPADMLLPEYLGPDRRARLPRTRHLWRANYAVMGRLLGLLRDRLAAEIAVRWDAGRLDPRPLEAAAYFRRMTAGRRKVPFAVAPAPQDRGRIEELAPIEDLPPCLSRLLRQGRHLKHPERYALSTSLERAFYTERSYAELALGPYRAEYGPRKTVQDMIEGYDHRGIWAKATPMRDERGRRNGYAAPTCVKMAKTLGCPFSGACDPRKECAAEFARTHPGKGRPSDERVDGPTTWLFWARRREN